jgi:hypothetical protein
MLSWRWGASKPSQRNLGFSPMSKDQLRWLQAMLQPAHEAGIEYCWVDWCCVPQYSASSMVEVQRSKVFYARAKLMCVLPEIKPMPEGGIVVVLLRKVHR